MVSLREKKMDLKKVSIFTKTYVAVRVFIAYFNLQIELFLNYLFQRDEDGQ